MPPDDELQRLRDFLKSAQATWSSPEVDRVVDKLASAEITTLPKLILTLRPGAKDVNEQLKAHGAKIFSPDTLSSLCLAASRLQSPLLEFMRSAQPEWNEGKVHAVVEKIVRAGILSLDELRLTLRPGAKDSLNNRLALGDEKRLAQETLMRLRNRAVEIFGEFRSARKDRSARKEEDDAGAQGAPGPAPGDAGGADGMGVALTLGDFLQAAPPQWSPCELRTIEAKLVAVGICTAADLVAALRPGVKRHVNRRLRSGGQTCLHSHTILDLREYAQKFRCESPHEAFGEDVDDGAQSVEHLGDDEEDDDDDAENEFALGTCWKRAADEAAEDYERAPGQTAREEDEHDGEAGEERRPGEDQSLVESRREAAAPAEEPQPPERPGTEPDPEQLGGSCESRAQEPPPSGERDLARPPPPSGGEEPPAEEPVACQALGFAGSPDIQRPAQGGAEAAGPTLEEEPPPGEEKEIPASAQEVWRRVWSAFLPPSVQSVVGPPGPRGADTVADAAVPPVPPEPPPGEEEEIAASSAQEARSASLPASVPSTVGPPGPCGTETIGDASADPSAAGLEDAPDIWSTGHGSVQSIVGSPGPGGGAEAIADASADPAAAGPEDARDVQSTVGAPRPGGVSEAIADASASPSAAGFEDAPDVQSTVGSPHPGGGAEAIADASADSAAAGPEDARDAIAGESAGASAAGLEDAPGVWSTGHGSEEAEPFPPALVGEEPSKGGPDAAEPPADLPAVPVAPGASRGPSPACAKGAVFKCATPGCAYQVSRLTGKGAYCCVGCISAAGGWHGGFCQRQAAAAGAPRAPRGWRSLPGSEVFELECQLYGIPLSMADADEEKTADKQRQDSESRAGEPTEVRVEKPVLGPSGWLLGDDELPVLLQACAQKLDGAREAAKTWDRRELFVFLQSRGLFEPTAMAARHRRPPPPARNRRVSVVVPTMERRHGWHQQLFEAFDGQDWPDKELVVVETYVDNPSSFFETKAREDERVVYVAMRVDRFNDLSIGLKRNMCIHLSSGAYVANFDDDDLYAPCYLTKMIQVMLDKGSDAITLATWAIFDCKTGRFGQVIPKGHMTESNKRAIDGWTFGYGFSYVYTRDVALNIPYPDWKFDPSFPSQEDYEFFTAIRMRNLRRQGCGFLAYMEPCGTAILEDSAGLCLHLLHATSTSDCWANVELPRERAQGLMVAALGAPFQRLLAKFPCHGSASRFIPKGDEPPQRSASLLDVLGGRRKLAPPRAATARPPPVPHFLSWLPDEGRVQRRIRQS